MGVRRRWALAQYGKRRRLAIVVVVAAAACASGVAYATIPDASGVIHGCYTNRGGLLRVIDTGSGGRCTSLETPLNWNQQGPKGDPGPQGLQGPPGPAGTLGSLDQLNGIPCRTDRTHPGTVHLAYGSGTEESVTLTCVIPVIANPGAFTVDVTGGSLTIPFFGSQALPTSGWRFGGQIDTGGHVTIPASGLQFPDISFAGTQDAGGFTSVHVTGRLSFTSTGLSGSLDPASGAATLGGGAYATVQLTATALVLGQTVELYSGACAFGSAASPLQLTLTTDPPGVPYSQATGAVTLSSAFAAPSLAGCSPAVPDLYAFLLDTFAGNDRITISGTTSPILRAA